MTQRGKLVLGLLFIGLVFMAGSAWWLNAKSQAQQFRIVLRGSSSASNNLGVSGGNLVVVAPKPGVFFGTVRKPGSEEQFTYLVLFRYGRPRSGGSSQGIQFQCTSDGRKAETKDAIELNGRRIEAAYRIELNEALAAVTSESLTIDGNSIDMTDGRIFLIDLTAETPNYQQKKVELPAIPSKLESTQDVEQLAEAIRMRLESEHPDIKEFLR